MALGDLCTCELVSHSDLGPVENSERIARLVTSPNHVRKNGKLKPGVFPLSHIEKSGLSLFRVDHMAEENIIAICNAIAMEGEEPIGVLIKTAVEVREIRDKDAHQALCVVDDPVINNPPYPDNPAHVIAITSKVRTDEEILEIRSDLFNLFENSLVKLGMVNS